jgi:hypothetical protein
MGELSDRFADLMARMAKSDADLFRTVGQQNAHLREMVDELVPISEGTLTADNSAALRPSGLLAADECDQKALKARFGKVAEAQSWIESQIGKAPKKPTWLMIEQTCRTGAWPATTKKAPTASKGLTPQQLDERLKAMEDRLTLRFERLEQILLLMVESRAMPDRASSQPTSPMA